LPCLPGDDDAALVLAARALRDGALVAFPTETVYGLGARADVDAAVAGIFAAKGRPSDHPLIVHVTDAAAALHFADAPGPSARRLMQRFWPGPLTLILPRRAGVGAAAAGGQGSIGLRCPSHPVAQALLARAAALGVPGVAAPSANRFGRVSPTRAGHVRQEFGDALLVLDGGPCEVGIESTIVDCTREPPALLRPGGVGRADIEAALGQPLRDPDAGSPRASGTLESHYAPAARVRLFTPTELSRAVEEAAREGLAAVAVYSRQAFASSGLAVWRQMPEAAAAAAHELFAVLRELDATGVAQIWVERPPADPAWDGVNDRLRRAAAA
jgi:L-threonylcarbamoyladenylate synthase